MSELVSYARQGEIGVITINNPPVNALSPGVPEGIVAGIDAAEKDPEVRAIVVIGGGRTFIAGADIKEFGKVTSGEKPRFSLNPVLEKIEDSVKPVVMAIHGTAFGGGLEIAMAGHYRVAVAAAQVGQPEVKLGIIPGAGGTQRLPRLAGVAKAVEMCAFGEPIDAKAALTAGIIDQIVEGDLLKGALDFARGVSGKLALKTRERNDKLQDAARNTAIFALAREQARKTRRGQMAPLAAIDAVEAATRLPFSDGMARGGGNLPRVPVLRPIEGSDSRVFRRARGLEDSGCSERHQDLRYPARGRDRRGHHGRRHRHELRQRGDPGDREGDHPGGARPRPRDHSQELRKLREKRPFFADRDGSADGADHAAAHLRRVSIRPTSSSRRCSRAWR